MPFKIRLGTEGGLWGQNGSPQAIELNYLKRGVGD